MRAAWSAVPLFLWSCQPADAVAPATGQTTQRDMVTARELSPGVAYRQFTDASGPWMMHLTRAGSRALARAGVDFGVGNAAQYGTAGGLGSVRHEADTKEDSAALVGRGVPWRVIAVQSLPEHRLAVQFADGTSGEVDVSKLIFGPMPGVFERLRDPACFAEVGIDQGAVSWPGQLDLAPDAMYDEIRANGSSTPV